MNSYLTDILAQPAELGRVLASLLAEEAENVRKITELLERADSIVLTSMGSAYYSLMPMYYALRDMGKNVALIETSELLYSPGLIHPGSLYVIMSRSGESYEVAAFPSLLRERGIGCAAITMTADSTMAKSASALLFDCASYDALICTKAYTSLALCGLVCVTMMGGDAAGRKLCFDRVFGMFDWMEQSKHTMLRGMEEIGLYAKVSGYNLLSRGYGMGVIASGSLWMEEASRMCGNVSSIDNFYHGSIELAKTEMAHLFLDVIPDVRSDMIWGKVCTYSPHTIYIAPEGREMRGGHRIAYPVFDVPDGYRMLLLAMYFQMLSYQSALANGIEPGKLETVSWVVK